jgi:quinol monooxygenase YgiN
MSISESELSAHDHERVALIARLASRPGMGPKLCAILTELVDETRHHRGVDLYSLHADPANPDILWSFELYANRAALLAHAESEAATSTGSRIAELLERAPDQYELRPIASIGLSEWVRAESG